MSIFSRAVLGKIRLSAIRRFTGFLRELLKILELTMWAHTLCVKHLAITTTKSTRTLLT